MIEGGSFPFLYDVFAEYLLGDRLATSMHQERKILEKGNRKEQKRKGKSDEVTGRSKDLAM